MQHSTKTENILGDQGLTIIVAVFIGCPCLGGAYDIPIPDSTGLLESATLSDAGATI